MRVRAAILDTVTSGRPFTKTRPLRIEELDLDPPGHGELLIRIEAAGVCHSDLSAVTGVRPWPLPLAVGHEAAGVVEETGPGVSDVREGDHVVLTFVPSCGACAECTAGHPTLCPTALAANLEGRLLGGGQRLHRSGVAVHHHLGVSAFADRAVVARGSAVVIPADFPLEVAALFGCAVLTGVGAVLNTARVRAGESVAIYGPGGIGLSVLLGAVLVGGHPIIAVDPVPAKRSLARELGATAAVDPSHAEEVIRDLAGGVRYAFEAVGKPAVLEAAYRSTARGGTTVAIGLPDPSAEVRLAAASLVAGARTVAGSYMGGAVPQRDIPRLLALWQAGRLLVDRLHSVTLDLNEANAALDALADGEVIRQALRPNAP